MRKRRNYLNISKLIERFESRPLIVSGERIITFGEYFQLSGETARRLQETGINNSERVAVLSRNCPEYLIALGALWQTGAVAVPVNIRFPGRQILSLLKKINCRKIILSRQIENAGDLSSLKKIIILEDLVSSHASTSSPSVIPDIDLNRKATILFTSGSGGEPKAVLHTIGNHYYSASGSNENIPFQPGDRWMLSLPLYHVGGLAILFRALTGGGAVAIPQPEMKLSKAIDQLGATHLSLVATQLQRLLDEEKAHKRLTQIKAILLGGSAIPQVLIRRSSEIGLPIYTSYGSTEMASQITTTPPVCSNDKLFTSGKLLKYREMKFTADGEIWVRGKTLFSGYVTGNSITCAGETDGWFPTGDRGKWDKDGYLIVTGRKDNMFITGGENIQPEEIEDALSRMEGIVQAVVVPVEDREFGLRPAAFLEFQPGRSMDEKRIREYLEKFIARYKIPDYFFPWPGKIKHSGIKIDRGYLSRLAGEYVQSHKKGI